MLSKNIIIFIVALLTPTFSVADPLRIFGGRDAVLGQLPYQVSIQVCGWTGCSHNCGGSIIAPNWIVTAGHCYSYGQKLKVVAGIVSLKDHNENRQTLDVIKSIVHEEYIGNANPNDIAVMQLNGSFVYNEWVQPVTLPDANSETVGEGVVSGWGVSSGHLFPHTPDILQYEAASIIDNQNCMEKLDKIMHGARNPFNVSANICSDNVEANYGICSGDSGGPICYDGKLVGISSWGMLPCGTKGAPSVFTKVSNYIDWIKKHIASLN